MSALLPIGGRMGARGGFGGLRAGLANKKTSVNWIAEGDSITLGQGGTPSYPFVALQSMPGGASFSWATLNFDASALVTPVGLVRCQDIATSGITAATINANFASRAGAQFDASKPLNIFSLMAGTNDSAGSTSAQIYGILRTILAKATAAGYQRKIIGTITARDDDGGTKWTNVISPLNVLIRTYYNNDLDCDALMDFGNDAKFSPAAAADSTTYYNVDKLHPNIAGEAAMGAIAEPGLYAAIVSGSRTAFPATWSVIDIGAAITLSNSNRTATNPPDLGNNCVRQFGGNTNGKWYGEVSVDNSNGTIFGLCNQNFNPNGGFLNTSSHAIGWGFDFGSNNLLKYNNSTTLTMGTFTTGDLIQQAVDIPNKLYWIRKSSGNWNNNGSANPATGVGGVDISALVADGNKIYHATGLYHSVGQVTCNFAQAQMTGPIPSGFKALDQ